MRQLLLFSVLLLLPFLGKAQCCCGEMVMRVKIQQPVYTHELVGVTIFDEDGRNLKDRLSVDFEDEHMRIEVMTGCGFLRLQMVIQHGRDQMVIEFFSVPSDYNYEYLPIAFNSGYYPVMVPETFSQELSGELDNDNQYYLEPMLKQSAPGQDLKIARIVNYSPEHKPNPILEITDHNAFIQRIGRGDEGSVMIMRWNHETGQWDKQGTYWLNDQLRTQVGVLGNGLYRVVFLSSDGRAFLLCHEQKW